MGSFFHELRPNHTAKSPKKLIFYDCESWIHGEYAKANTQTYRLNCANFLYKKEKVYRQALKPHVYKSSYEFWESVDSFVKEKETVYVYAHNQQFDFIISKGFTNLALLGWELKFHSIEGQRWIIKYTKPGKSLIILDTANYFKGSVKTFGKMLKFPKMEIDFKKTDEKYLITYCQRDVDIITKLIIEFIDFLAINDFGTLQYTLASQSFKCFRHKFMHHRIFIHASELATKLERRSYTGGLNLLYKIGKHTGRFYKTDINSLYPSIMRDNEFPTKLISIKGGATISELKEYLKNYLVIADVDLDTTHPYFPKRAERLILPLGKFSTTLTTPFLKLATELHVIKKINTIALYEHAPIFKEFVEYLYNLRLHYKREKNAVYTYLVKILMNSLYGKFGQRNSIDVEIGEAPKEQFSSEYCVKYETGQRFQQITFSGKIIARKVFFEEFKDSFVAIASHVTDYSKLYLLQLIDVCGEENMYYCDTDSLFVNKPGCQNLIPYLSQTELGMLKIEDFSKEIELRGCKDYIFGDAEHIKGVHDLTDTDGLGNYNMQQFVKFRTALREKKEGVIEVRYITKHLSRQYKKGVVLPDKTIMPLTLNETWAVTD